jgi:opacity protein-like surface antigen
MKLISRALPAAAVVAAGLALSAGGAAAQGMFGGGGFYLKGFGGLTVPQDDDFQINARGGGGSADTGLDFDNGYILGIAGGYMLTPNVAVELEYAYRNADAEFKDFDGPSTTTESNAWMVNAIYNFTPMGGSGAWQPYAGGGLGAADLNVERIDSLDGGDFDSDYNFAYQLIGGVKYNLPSGWSLAGEARFFGINDQDLENDVLSFKSTYQTFDLLLGVSYSF